MVRKSLFFVVTLLIMGWAGYQLAWHPEAMPEGVGVGKSALAIIVGIAALAFLAWAIVTPSGGKVLLSFVLGIIAAKLGDDLWSSIGWREFGWLLLGLVAVGVLYAGTVLDLTAGWFTSLRLKVKDLL